MQKNKSAKERREAQVRRRKKLRPIDRLSSAEKWEIMEAYIRGKSILDIAETINVYHKDLDAMVSKFYGALVNTRETNSLITSQALSKNCGTEVAPKFKNPALINEDFKALLSEWSSDCCTPAENMYAQTYALTGDNKRAIKLAGLDVGIMKTADAASKKNMISLRGVYLRQKPVIKATIEKLKERILDTVLLEKGFIQTELVHQIAQLKEEVSDDPRARGHLMRAIELLGKSIPGTFAERIEVHEVDPKEALSTLVDMAKKANGTVVDASTGLELLDE